MIDAAFIAAFVASKQRMLAVQSCRVGVFAHHWPRSVGEYAHPTKLWVESPVAISASPIRGWASGA